MGEFTGGYGQYYCQHQKDKSKLHHYLNFAIDKTLLMCSANDGTVHASDEGSQLGGGPYGEPYQKQGAVTLSTTTPCEEPISC